MAVLKAIQDACLGGVALDKPGAVFGTSTRELLELTQIVQQAADEIALAHEWSELDVLETMTGDGSTTAFTLPSDYRRMLTDTQVWSSVQNTPLPLIKNRNTWLGEIIRGDVPIVARCIIYGGQFRFNPAPASGELVKYWYQSSEIVTAADASTKAELTLDTDIFRLDETLLKLGIIWKWRHMKGLPYAEHLNNYERRLSKLIAPDAGTETIALGGMPFLAHGDQMAYPKGFTEG
jgi:hypothetical protein